jgi:hypothetical protein
MKRTLASVAVVLAVYLASFVRTADYGWVWDDVPEIALDRSFDGPLASGMSLTQIERSAPALADLPQLQFGYDSYRPLLYASLWLDIRLWGRSPGALHGSNVFLGAVVLLLVYLVAHRLVGSRAVVVMAIFALHPIQIETVAYISARGDLLASGFVLAATYACLRAREHVGWMIAATLLFAASLFSKESYILLPLAVAGLALTRRTPWMCVVSMLVVIGVYALVRSLVVTTTSSPAYVDALVAAPGILLQYLRIVLLPFDLSIERLPDDRYTVAGWLTAALAFAGIALVILRRKQLPEWVRIPLIGAGWTIALLGPSLVVIATMHVVADRYFYAPMFGAAIAAVVLLDRLVTIYPRLARPLVAAIVVWGAMVMVVGWRQVTVWHDVSSLYRHAAELAPDSSRAQYRVAYLDIQRERWDLAVPRLEHAIELDGANAPALNNLGVYLMRKGRFADAEVLLAKAVTVNPARFNSWLNLGISQIQGGNRSAGCASIARALSINPSFAEASLEYSRSCLSRP